MHSYKRVEYGAGGEKKKWKSEKQTKGRRIKIFWVSVKLLKIFRPLKISGCNSSWACFSFWWCSAFHIVCLSLLQVNERSYLPFERSLFFFPAQGMITQGKVLKTPINLRNWTNSLNIFKVLSFPLRWHVSTAPLTLTEDILRCIC